MYMYHQSCRIRAFRKTHVTMMHLIGWKGGTFPQTNHRAKEEKTSALPFCFHQSVADNHIHSIPTLFYVCLWCYTSSSGCEWHAQKRWPGDDILLRKKKKKKDISFGGSRLFQLSSNWKAKRTCYYIRCVSLFCLILLILVYIKAPSLPTPKQVKTANKIYKL